MNKKIVSALAIVSLLGLLGGCKEDAPQPQKPAPQFGVVQLSKLYQESQVGKLGIARVTELEGKAMEIFKDIQAPLEKARAEKNEAEVARLEQDLQSRAYFLQNVIKQDQEHVANVIQTELRKAMDKYSADHGLFGMFSAETMLVSSPEVDVTEGVKAILDSVKPDFGALPSLEMPKLPEPANALPDEAPAAEAPAAEAAPAPVN